MCIATPATTPAATGLGYLGPRHGKATARAGFPGGAAQHSEQENRTWRSGTGLTQKAPASVLRASCVQPRRGQTGGNRLGLGSELRRLAAWGASARDKLACVASAQRHARTRRPKRARPTVG